MAYRRQLPRTRPKLLRQRPGFTLLELVVAMSIFAVVLLSTMLALNESFMISVHSRRRQEAQQDMSAALEQITRQLRQAQSVAYPAAGTAAHIDTSASSGSLLRFVDSNNNQITYGVGTPTDPAEIVTPAAAGARNYQLTVQWGAGSATQALTEQNVTSFTVERPAWSNDVVIITLQSVQRDATGMKTSPLCLMSMVTLRQ